MKVKRHSISKVHVLMLTSFLLSSCYSYKPYLDNQRHSPSTMKEKILRGQKYEVLLTGGQVMFIKVNSVEEDRLIGDVFANRKGGNFRQNNFIIPFNQIEGVKNRKVSAGKTTAAIIIPVGLLVIILSSAEYDLSQ